MRFELLQAQRDSVFHRFTGQAFNWLMVYGVRIVVAVLLFIVGQWLIRFLNREFKKILSAKRFDATLRPFMQNLVQLLLQGLLVFALMQVLGIRMTIFAAVIGALGVAIGLALSGTLQNFAAGVLIILLKPFVVGDNIKTQGEEGTVMFIRLFYTVIRTFSNTTLVVPNGKLSNEVIFNLTREKTRRLDISIKFSHTVDFAQVKADMLEAVASLEPVLKNPAARIGVEKIEADGFTVCLNLWVQSHGFQDARLVVNERLMQVLKDLLVKR